MRPDRDDHDRAGEPWWLEQVMDAAACAAVVLVLLLLLVRPALPTALPTTPPGALPGGRDVPCLPALLAHG